MVFFILILLSLIVETLVVKTPVTFVIIFMMLIYNPRSQVFVLAFLTGLILDILNLNSMGISSIFFLIFLFIVFSYKRKFEIRSAHAVFLFSYLGSMFYSVLVGYSGFLFQAFFMGLLSLFLFKSLSTKTQKDMIAY